MNIFIDDEAQVDSNPSSQGSIGVSPRTSFTVLPSDTSQSKLWFFTLFVSEGDDYLQGVDHANGAVEDFCCQLEKASTTSRLHVQGCIKFTTRKRFTAVKKFFPDGTHLEIIRKGWAAACKYCNKEDTCVMGPDGKPLLIVTGKLNTSLYM